MLKALALTSMLLGSSTAASAQELFVQPAALLHAFSVNCLETAPDFQDNLPKIARKARWEELSKAPGSPATKRGWLMSVDHTQAIVSINTNTSGHPTCALSSTSLGQAVDIEAKREIGRPADGTANENGMVTLRWRYKRADTPPSILAITYDPHKPLTRLMITIGATDPAIGS